MTKYWILLGKNLCKISRRFCQVQRWIRAEVWVAGGNIRADVTVRKTFTATTILGYLLVVEVQKADVSITELVFVDPIPSTSG